MPVVPGASCRSRNLPFVQVAEGDSAKGKEWDVRAVPGPVSEWLLLIEQYISEVSLY